MHGRRLPIALTVAAVLAGAVALLLSSFATAGDDRSLTAVATQATAKYHDLDAAIRDGWSTKVADVNNLTCIADTSGQNLGGMGVHYADVGRIFDGGAIDPTRPEALVYAPNAAGKPKLAALEYILLASDWRGGQIDVPPLLFDHQFFYTPAPNRFGLPAFWALHVWIWEPNPSGTFMPWNPRVTCPS